MNEFSALEASTGQAARTLENRRLDNLRQGLTGEGFGRNLRAASYFFPENYNNIYHYIIFRALKFESVTRTSTIRSDEPIVSNRRSTSSRVLTTITLPMPDQLQTGYKANYTDPDMSSFGEVLATGTSNINSEQIGNAYQSGGLAAATAILAQQVGGGAAAGAAAADVAGRLGGQTPSLSAAAANNLGIARNAQKVLLFSGLDFREHRFSFKLTPRNRKEADMIQKIITAFKTHMLPKYGLGSDINGALTNNSQAIGNQVGASPEQVQNFASQAASRAFFEYPDVFQISFNNEKRLFTIGESVLQSFDIDYHPQNYPAYVRSLSSPGDAAPASITINMSFKETDVVTREQVTENFR
jgi:hypothetical protein